MSSEFTYWDSHLTYALLREACDIMLASQRASAWYWKVVREGRCRWKLDVSVNTNMHF